MIEKKLGKISHSYFGVIEGMMGLSVALQADGYCVDDFKGFWDWESTKRSEYTKWTENERDKRLLDTLKFLSKLLKQAKVKCAEDLKGKPVEVTFEGNTLKDWRLLTEVL